MITKIWTIGHSTREMNIFIALLEAYGIKLLADVRLLPGSKRYPQFNKASLESLLRTEGMRYEHFPELGGRRKPQSHSRSNAWRNESFRGYADYMETEEFREGMTRLTSLAEETGPAALMCAEAVWWRCHRALISDFLKARGVEVVHILAAEKTQLHPYTSAARIVDGELSYATDDSLL